jgi:hypothetical protein
MHKSLGGIAIACVVALLLPASVQAISFSKQTFPLGHDGFGPVAVATGDFDGDGHQDAAVVSDDPATPDDSFTVNAFLGNGHGAFTDTGTQTFAGERPDQVAAGDLDGDGLTDLAISVADFNVTTPEQVDTDELDILFATGGGSFTTGTTIDVGDDPGGVFIGDFDENQTPDIAVASANSHDVTIVPGHGDRTFDDPSSVAMPLDYPSGNVLVAGRFDQGADLDLAVLTSNSGNAYLSLLRGGPGSTFSSPIHTIVNGVNTLTTADFDDDGNLDVAGTNGANLPSEVLLGNGNGDFPTSKPFGTPAGDNREIDPGDFNSDGFLDVVIAGTPGSGASSTGVAIEFGDGTGDLPVGEAFPTGVAPYSAAVADFDGDADPDLAVANHGSSPAPGSLAILLNGGLYYPRPSGAPKTTVSLVPAYRACGTPNETHGPPLAEPSCSPAAPASDFLTVGTTDSNGAAAASTGSVTYKAMEIGPHQSDVLIDVSTSDVRCVSGSGPACGSANAAAGPDYTGELQAVTVLRITDRHYFPISAGTTQDAPFAVTVPCTQTVSGGAGSTCSVSTSAQSVVPGSVPWHERSVWELGTVELYDGGSSALAGASDATVFERQGVFVP